jgi:folate-binding protein YgfZ
MIPAVSPGANVAYDAARRRAAVLDRSDRGRVLISGADRASYLQGLFTNDIAALGPGQGLYTAWLTPQGRMIADLWVYELGDGILLTMDGGVRETVCTKLEQFVFAEDVQVVDATEALSQVAIIGPHAAPMAAAALGVPRESVERIGERGNVRLASAVGPTIVTRTTDAGEGGYDLYGPGAASGALVERLTAAGAAPLDPETAEAIRIEAGVPRFHRDMDEETIPLEAGLESTAISFTKGCYVGQEVIVRVLHRGHGRIARKLVGLAIEGAAVPPAGAAVRAGEREIGRVTSAVFSPALQRPIALAYVHRDFVEPGTRVKIDGADAAVTALPFVGRHD